ncbi:MAG TPA: 4Fe-4S binding protein [Dehalococcoidia bacterium]|nr:4Fe-4S binding protein [Dehalococcoidia bacterium]
MAYVIDLKACINCSLCRRNCPTECIVYYRTGHRTHVIDPEGCIDCDICAQYCPVDCISIDATYVPDPVKLEAAKERARQWARRRRQEQLAAREAAKRTLAAIRGA